MGALAQVGQRAPARDRIIAAAIRRFESHGIAQTTMADIADEAGLSRQTVYRQFTDRPALLEAILLHRFVAVLELAREEYQSYRSLREALVEGPLFAMACVQKDGLFRNIVTNATDRRIEDYVLIAAQEIRDLTYSVWQPLFAKARLSGELRSELSNVRLAECVRSVAALLTLRSDLDEGEKRQFLKDFLVPAVLGVVEQPASSSGDAGAGPPANRKDLEHGIAEAARTLTGQGLARLAQIAAILE